MKIADPVATDETHPDTDLVIGYIARRGVKTFHVRKPTTKTKTACGLKLADLTTAGWVRGLRRQGLEPCDKGCAAILDVVAQVPGDTEE